ncbi:Protein of unknown function [Asanoa hainanensis]|uniref:DUF4229 domain-containing protein n=1 Tax=Asanoa hainanensis TaxID=560556 RepID=A0A239NQB5_9ACTN|nr:DUF4229 domain-containing protein [Asanoa hainanensis]SNT56950.1 Protein of unknown function [Asanoa hainanensis]
MSPTVKYTLARLGLFVVIFAVLIPIPMGLFLKLILALAFSATISWFFLRTWRDQMAQQLADTVDKRRADKAKLRSALAGDDEPPATAP